MSITKSLQKLCLQVSEWAVGKIAANDGMSCLLMVMTAEGEVSATNIILDSMEEATALARQELTSGHYAGSQMYVCARHVSWFEESGYQQHAILMDCEEAGHGPPLTLGRTFEIRAGGQFTISDEMAVYEMPAWSAYA